MIDIWMILQKRTKKKWVKCAALMFIVRMKIGLLYWCVQRATVRLRNRATLLINLLFRMVIRCNHMQEIMDNDI